MTSLNMIRIFRNSNDTDQQTKTQSFILYLIQIIFQVTSLIIQHFKPQLRILLIVITYLLLTLRLLDTTSHTNDIKDESLPEFLFMICGFMLIHTFLFDLLFLPWKTQVFCFLYFMLTFCFNYMDNFQYIPQYILYLIMVTLFLRYK